MSTFGLAAPLSVPVPLLCSFWTARYEPYELSSRCVGYTVLVWGYWLSRDAWLCSPSRAGRDGTLLWNVDVQVSAVVGGGDSGGKYSVVVFDDDDGCCALLLLLYIGLFHRNIDVLHFPYVA